MKKRDNNKVVMVLDRDLEYPVLDRRVFKEALSLKNNGYNVHIITWSMRVDPNLYPENFGKEGIKVYRIFKKIVDPQKSIIYKILPFISFFRKTIKLLRDMKPNIIHCHDAFPLVASYIGAKFTRAKLIYDSHELNPFLEEPFLFRLFFNISEKIVFHRLSCIITANEVRKLFMQKRVKKKMKYYPIHNYPKFDTELKFEANSPGQQMRFIYQGVVLKIRGIDNILLAFSKINNNDITIDIYGIYQPNKEKYIRLVDKYNLSNRVRLHDPLDIKFLKKEMDKMDVGILSLFNSSVNNYYCAPNKLYDYMKSGLIILGPKFPHMRKIIEGNNIGFCCDFEDINSIKKAFLNIEKHKDEIYDMKKTSFDLYKNIYNWDNEEKKLLEIYEELI